MPSAYITARIQGNEPEEQISINEYCRVAAQYDVPRMTIVLAKPRTEISTLTSEALADVSDPAQQSLLRTFIQGMALAFDPSQFDLDYVLGLPNDVIVTTESQCAGAER